MRAGLGRALRALAVLVVLDLVAVAVNRSIVTVRGRSMEPALRPGDRLLTVPAAPAVVRAGQVVVLRDPADPGHLVVKRVAEVGVGRVVVLGDSPERSTDSRVWGSVPLESVRRVAVARLPRLDRWRRSRNR